MNSEKAKTAVLLRTIDSTTYYGYKSYTDISYQLDSAGNLLISGNGNMMGYDYGYRPSPWYDYREQIKKVILAETKNLLILHTYNI